MNIELKEPVKWVITPNGTLEVSLQNQTYIVECPQIVVDAHNLAIDTLYKQAVELRDNYNLAHSELGKYVGMCGNLQIELARLRQLIEQDAKAREMQSEAEQRLEIKFEKQSKTIPGVDY